MKYYNDKDESNVLELIDELRECLVTVYKGRGFSAAMSEMFADDNVFHLKADIEDIIERTINEYELAKLLNIIKKNTKVKIILR